MTPQETDCRIKQNAKVQDMKDGQWGTMVRSARAKILSHKYGVYTVQFHDKILKVDYADIELD